MVKILILGNLDLQGYEVAKSLSDGGKNSCPFQCQGITDSSPFSLRWTEIFRPDASGPSINTASKNHYLRLRNGPETTSRFHTDWGTAR